MLWFGLYFIIFFIFIIIFKLSKIQNFEFFLDINIYINYYFLYITLTLIAIITIFLFIIITFIFWYLSFELYFFNRNWINLNIFIYLDIKNIYMVSIYYLLLVITFISILYCLSYNSEEFFYFIIYLLIIIILGFLIIFIDSILLFLIVYELFLLPSFLILYKFAKTRKAVEAAYLMFFWTQLGAFFLFFSFFYIILINNCYYFSKLIFLKLNTFETNILLLCWFIGFGVKIPLWPFYSWLPKAHVEASTNFSIFLSGVLVKFAFFGFIRCFFSLTINTSNYWLLVLTFIGLCEAFFKLFFQNDLKKLVAYATIVEMHWLFLCLFSGQTCLYYCLLTMLVSHAILSTTSFLIVDSINRRFHTRSIMELGCIYNICPNLYIVSYLNCIFILGFPGTLFFLSELIFFIFILDLYPIIGFIIFIIIYIIVPLFFFKAWLSIWYTNITISSYIIYDLTKYEVFVFMFLFSILIFLGIFNSIFFF